MIYILFNQNDKNGVRAVYEKPASMAYVEAEEIVKQAANNDILDGGGCCQATLESHGFRSVEWTAIQVYCE
jgi:hypothetical protein